MARVLPAEGMHTALAIEGRLRVEQRATPALVAYAQLLAATTRDIDRFVEQELAANPALERVAPAGGSVPGFDAGGALPEAVDEPALLEQIAAEVRLTLPGRDVRVLELLLDSLDEHGFLSLSEAELASACGVSIERVEHVLEVVRALAPVGVACRDVVHCLDVQLQRLADESELVALARRILAEGLADLAAGRYGALGRRVGADRDAVVAARDLIRRRTRPYPVLDRPLRHGDREPAPAPDVVISVSREDPAVLVVALAEEQRCALRVSPAYIALGGAAARAQIRRAHAVTRRLGERWSTIRRVVEQLVLEQRAFMLEGPAAQRPLTRARVAAALGLHESTVSRAVAGRTAALPCGRVVALASFFTPALAPQQALREIVAQEPRPLSDAELAARLASCGHPVARRTVAKYRAALDIAPSARRSGGEARFANRGRTANSVSSAG